MRLATRIGAGFLGLVALMVAVGVYQLATIESLKEESLHLAETGFEAGKLGLRLRAGVAELRDLTERLQVLGDAEYAAGLDAWRRQVAAQVEGLAALDLSALERPVVDELVAQWAAYARTAPDAEARWVADGDVAALDGELARLDGLRGEIGRLLDTSERAVDLRLAASAERVSRARDVAFVTWLVGVLAALLASGFLVRTMASSLGRVQRGAHELGGGDLKHRVPVEGPEEFAALAADFNAMADRLEELERLKRDFVSMVSHELKAPLASMQETLRLVLDGSLGPLDAEQIRILRLTETSADRLARMIHDLLDLACLEAGAMEYDFRRVDLREVAREAAAEFEPSVRRRGLGLGLDLPDRPLEIEADRGLLLQVLHNLISNAVKFTPNGGRVGVAVHRVESGVVLEVTDTGPGVPDAHKDRIFERFHRADSRAPGRQGTGLGLAIARGLVEGHGGTIRVEDAVGGGSVFRVWIPSGRAVATSREKGETV